MTAAEAHGGGRRGAARAGAAARRGALHARRCPFSHRSGERIEPLISLQWFCRMDELARPAIEVVEDGRRRFVPDAGPRLSGLDGEIRPGASPASSGGVTGCRSGTRRRGDLCRRGAARRARRLGAQDPDVLDTWFSSALWPFATLGWPERHARAEGVLPDRRADHGPRHHLPLGRADDHDLARVHRRDSVRGRLHPLGDPGARRAADEQVARHRDRPARRDRRARRRRLRFGLLAMSSTQDVRFSEARVQQGRDLANKMWNASRLILIDAGDDVEPGAATAATVEDRWIASRLAARDRIGDARAIDGLRLRPRGARPLRLLLVGALRLVPRDRQAAALRRRRGRVREAALGARAGARAGCTR